MRSELNLWGAKGQGHTEYALLVALVAVVVVASLTLLGPAASEQLKTAAAALGGTPQPQPVLPRFLQIKDDFTQRILAYYEANARWPRSWGDYVYTDIGLDPDDWDEPVEGMWWGSNAGRVVIGSEHDDGYQLYVTDLAGNRLHLYDGWNIWCPVLETVCYYHRVAPGNEVDITTLEVVPD
jgi:Flp pilus assembly pilin Flp